MSGGILQLVAYGKNDLFLTSDPQITFFKISYRRYTNFSREDIEQYFVTNPDFGKKTTCSLAFEGDLIENITLKIILPSISKFYNCDGSLSITKFAWVRRIGYAILKSIEIEINGMIIDRQYGEWLNIIHELTTISRDDGAIDKLIGDVPELTNFTSGKNSYQLFIPLKFWFCKSTGLALPLVCLQYSDIKLNVELEEFEKCHLITPTHYIKCIDSITNFIPYEFIKQTIDGIDRYGMFYKYDIINNKLYYTAIGDNKLIGPDDQNNILNSNKIQQYKIIGNSSKYEATPANNAKSFIYHNRFLNITIKECFALVTYVFLDQDERYKFARTKHDYLIEQLYFTPNVTIYGINRNIRINAEQPCKMMVWLTQFDYIKNMNDTFNYSDSHIKSNKSIITNETIALNGHDIVSMRDDKYFNIIQSLQHFKNDLPVGIDVYSFSLHPEEIQPSGTCNLSQIELIELKMRLSQKVTTNNKAKCRVYCLCYNILRINNGLAATVFTE